MINGCIVSKNLKMDAQLNMSGLTVRSIPVIMEMIENKAAKS
jgi:hypothetical protein